MRSGSNAGLIIAVVIVSLIVGVIGGLGGAYFFGPEAPPPEAGMETPPGEDDGGEQQVRIVTDEDAIVEVVDTADPAVVKIVATTEAQPSNPFEYFFGRGEPRVQRGIGSGFIFDYNGRHLVLTNSHVVGEAQQIKVQMRDGQEFNASLLGDDPASDVAVLELEGDVDELPTVTLGDSDELAIGEWVVAIGHPFAFDHTVTVGIVSAQGSRSPGPQMPARNMIQTDAAINQGNSGGPLLNIKGELIGINTAIRPEAQSIGFAISVDTLRSLLPEMLNIEKLSRVIFGATVRQKPLARGGEVLVTAVRDNTPAAGVLQPGDHLLKINASEIRHITHYVFAMLDLRPGDDVNLTVRRNGRVQTLRLTLQARPAPDGKALARAKLGLDLRAITPTLARDLSLPVRNGLLVTGVAKASPAARVGIRPGDVLFQVGGFTVADFDALMPVLDDLPDGAPTTVGILRGNTAVLIRLRLAPKHSNPRSGP